VVITHEDFWVEGRLALGMSSTGVHSGLGFLKVLVWWGSLVGFGGVWWGEL
jgi:hypothetical protein